jgi:predicted negative regulator of RcsB-dependent stress response
MSRHETDQDQLEMLKAWWAKNGTWLLSVILVVAVSFAGYRYWQSYTYAQAANASALFEVLQISQQNKQFGEVSREARKLMQEQPSSPYAGSAAMMLAQYHWEQGDKQQALDDLGWILTAKQTDEMKQIAKLRLARMFIDMQNFEQAQQQLLSIDTSVINATQKANVDYVTGQLAIAQKDYATAHQALQRVVENEDAFADLKNIARLQMNDIAK